jgi:threonylcarbamoyladenosine tRNA methylthiotransferase MtaB
MTALPVINRAAPAVAPASPAFPPGTRVRVDTMGCRVNRYDAALLRAEVAALGGEVVSDGAPFDLYVLNTCTVTHQADAEARRLARRAKRAHGDARVAVTGCYAEVSPEALAAMPEVDLVAGNRDKPALAARLAALARGHDAAPPSHDRDRHWGREWIFGGGAGRLPDPAGDTRLFLKVQEGCDQPCAFCIIPTARGAARSMPPEDVVAAVRAGGEAGYREAILAGIHLGGYGRDRGDIDFAGLLKRVLAETDMPRIRFGSLEPWGVTDAFVDLFAAERRLLPSLHLPLQSGSAPVLKRMRRPCTPDFYRRQAERIVAARPDVFLSTDVMAGFPGETDAEFTEGLAFIDALPFAHLHVFPYSPRAGTPAAGMAEQVSPEVKRDRAHTLIALSDAKKARALERQVGAVTDVLVEPGNTGHAHNHFPVRIAGPAIPPGTIVPCRVTGHDGAVLEGTPA